MNKSLARGVAAFGGAAALFVVFGSGSAAAINEYKGMTYADAANQIAQSGGSAVIATKVGSFLPTNRCTVTGSHTGNFLNSSGSNNGGLTMLDLNCNYSFALPGVPGNSIASPEGKAAHDQAVAEAQKQAEEAQAAQQAAADSAAGGG